MERAHSLFHQGLIAQNAMQDAEKNYQMALNRRTSAQRGVAMSKAQVVQAKAQVAQAKAAPKPRKGTTRMRKACQRLAGGVGMGGAVSIGLAGIKAPIRPRLGGW